MKFKSEQTVYNIQKKKNIPVWMLDTSTNTVTYYDADTHTEECKSYHSDSVKYHLSFLASKYPDRLRRLVNNGTVLEYLDDLEQKVADAIDSQVERWKKSDKEYQQALKSGDYQKAAGLANMLVLMAREAIFDSMVYI